MNWLSGCGCKTSARITWQERQMADASRMFQAERFQDALRAGWLQPRFLSTNLKFMPDGRMIITPFEDTITSPLDYWAVGIELSIIDDDGDRKDPEPFLIHHAFGSSEAKTQYKSLLQHPIPLVPTSRRVHKWWVEGLGRDNYYLSARLIAVEIAGSHGIDLDEFLAVFYDDAGNIVGEIGVDNQDYMWPRRCSYLNAGELRFGSTPHTLAIPPTCRLFDIRRGLSGGYREFEALTEPMDFWNVRPLRRPGLSLTLARELMWMNGRGARSACAHATSQFKEELFMRAWAPVRHVEWCLDIEEQAEMLEDDETFESWRMAAEAAEKKMYDSE